MRSEPRVSDRAIALRGGMGIAAAPPRIEAMRRELVRLTALLRHHFNRGGEDSLLPALASGSDADLTASAKEFLERMQSLIDVLDRNARQWSVAADLADAFGDVRRETMFLLQGIERMFFRTPD
ncbi:MAG: hypothetical protein ABR588_04015 [Sphingomicrobium sp.]|nr:hypothetical protein [Sphingomonadales bacterium]